MLQIRQKGTRFKQHFARAQERGGPEEYNCFKKASMNRNYCAQIRKVESRFPGLGRVRATAFCPAVRAGRRASASCEAITCSVRVRSVCWARWACSGKIAVRAPPIFKTDPEPSCKPDQRTFPEQHEFPDGKSKPGARHPEHLAGSSVSRDSGLEPHHALDHTHRVSAEPEYRRR